MSYVRRLVTGQNALVYHRADCRHARGKDDVVAVSEGEVAAAYLRHARHQGPVQFEGRRVLIWVCRQCLRHGPPPDTAWPPPV